MKQDLVPLLALVLGSISLGACALDEAGAGGAGTSTGGARFGEGGAGSAAAGWQDVLARQELPGEHYVGIWGAGDDLWVIGAPAGKVVTDGAGGASGTVATGGDAEPMILVCDEERFAAPHAVRRGGDAGWELVEVPATTSLMALHGSGEGDVWLVGLDGAVLELAGGAWREHDVRQAEGLEFQEGDDPCPELSLFGVFARTPTDVWVAGYLFPSASGPGLILHFDGSGWRREAVDAPDGLFAVWASSASDVWAVGASGIAYHFDGARWNRVDTGTDHHLFEVGGTAADDVWAVGVQGVATHFDGTRWTVLSEPGASSVREGLTIDGEGRVWTLETFTEPPGTFAQRLVFWTGTAWREEASTTDLGEALGDLWATPSGELWGAGAGVIRLR